jgi:hypothetical protein
MKDQRESYRNASLLVSNHQIIFNRRNGYGATLACCMKECAPSVVLSLEPKRVLSKPDFIGIAEKLWESSSCAFPRTRAIDSLGQERFRERRCWSMRLLTHNQLANCTDRPFRGRALVQMENDSARSGIVDVNPASSGYSLRRWQYIMRPLNLGLIGLAVAVALWGFTYKLSLYNPDQNHSAPISVAKLWLGPERTLLISMSRPKCQFQLGRTLDSVLMQQFEARPEAYNRRMSASDASVSRRRRFTDCIPRSPPPHMN